MASDAACKAAGSALSVFRTASRTAPACVEPRGVRRDSESTKASAAVRQKTATANRSIRTNPPPPSQTRPRSALRRWVFPEPKRPDRTSPAGEAIGARVRAKNSARILSAISPCRPSTWQGGSAHTSAQPQRSLEVGAGHSCERRLHRAILRKCISLRHTAPAEGSAAKSGSAYGSASGLTLPSFSIHETADISQRCSSPLRIFSLPVRLKGVKRPRVCSRSRRDYTIAEVPRSRRLPTLIRFVDRPRRTGGARLWRPVLSGDVRESRRRTRSRETMELPKAPK